MTNKRTPDELNPPKLLVLPSGRPFRLDLLVDFLETGEPFAPKGHPFMARFDVRVATNEFRPVHFYNATDAAAIRSAILRYGVQAEAATIRKESTDAVLGE